MALIWFFQPIMTVVLGWFGIHTVSTIYGWSWLLSQVVLILVLTVVLLVILAFLLLFDRKVWAAVQLRRGPNVVGAFGLG